MVHFLCPNCGNDKFKTDLVDEPYLIDGRLFLVEDIPAKVCTNCNEPRFSVKTAEQIWALVNSDTKPVRYISTEVYEFSQAK